jgi:hypothetical protein
VSSNIQSFNFTNYFSTNVSVGGQQLQNLITQTDNATASFPSRYNITVQLNNIQSGLELLTTLANNDTLLKNAIDASINKTKQLMADFHNLPDPSLPDIGHYILDGIKTVGGIPAELVHDAFGLAGSLFGGGIFGNLFSGFLGQLLWFVIFFTPTYFIFIRPGLNKGDSSVFSDIAKVARKTVTGRGDPYEREMLIKGDRRVGGSGRARSSKH